MSWDAYVDSLCGDKSCITKAAIIGLDGSIWTPYTEGKDSILRIDPEDAVKIAGVMAKKQCAAFQVFQQSGLIICKTKYTFLRDMDNDGRIMTAKKQGVGSLVLQSTLQGVIIAFTPDEKGDLARTAPGLVEKIAQYLEKSGY